MFAYCENDPVNYDDPSGCVYYRADSVNYARRHAKTENYNKAFVNLNNKGGDCTNFVSQCLRAGGMKDDKTWFYKSKKNFSPTWSFASKLYAYLIKKTSSEKLSY